MKNQTIQLKINEKTLNEISSKIATEVTNKIYHNFLLARYLPEIKAIERGKIKALRGKKIELYLKQKISSSK